MSILRMGEDYIEFLENGLFATTDPQILTKAFETDVQFPLRTNTGIVTLPFSTAWLIHTSDVLKFFNDYSKKHRLLFSSKYFSDLAKPFSRLSFENSIKRKELLLNAHDTPEFSPIWDEVFEQHVDIEYGVVRKNLNLKKSDTVLEIGPATGNLSVRIARDVKKIVGVDSSEAYVSYAREKTKKLGIINCEFVTGHYPMSFDEEFDYVLSFGIYPSVLTYGNPPPKFSLVGSFGSLSDVPRKQDDYERLYNFYNVKKIRERISELGDKMFLDYFILKRKQ